MEFNRANEREHGDRQPPTKGNNPTKAVNFLTPEATDEMTVERREGDFPDELTVSTLPGEQVVPDLENFKDKVYLVHFKQGNDLVNFIDCLSNLDSLLHSFFALFARFRKEGPVRVKGDKKNTNKLTNKLVSPSYCLTKVWISMTRLQKIYDVFLEDVAFRSFDLLRKSRKGDRMRLREEFIVPMSVYAAKAVQIMRNIVPPGDVRKYWNGFRQRVRNCTTYTRKIYRDFSNIYSVAGNPFTADEPEVFRSYYEACLLVYKKLSKLIRKYLEPHRSGDRVTEKEVEAEYKQLFGNPPKPPTLPQNGSGDLDLKKWKYQDGFDIFRPDKDDELDKVDRRFKDIPDLDFGRHGIPKDTMFGPYRTIRLPIEARVGPKLTLEVPDTMLYSCGFPDDFVQVISPKLEMLHYFTHTDIYNISNGSRSTTFHFIHPLTKNSGASDWTKEQASLDRLKSDATSYENSELLSGSPGGEHILNPVKNQLQLLFQNGGFMVANPNKAFNIFAFSPDGADVVFDLGSKKLPEYSLPPISKRDDGLMPVIHPFPIYPALSGPFFNDSRTDPLLKAVFVPEELPESKVRALSFVTYNGNERQEFDKVFRFLPATTGFANHDIALQSKQMLQVKFNSLTFLEKNQKRLSPGDQQELNEWILGNNTGPKYY